MRTLVWKTFGRDQGGAASGATRSGSLFLGAFTFGETGVIRAAAVSCDLPGGAILFSERRSTVKGGCPMKHPERGTRRRRWPVAAGKEGEEDVAVLLFPGLHITASGASPRGGQAAHIRTRWSLVRLWQQGLSSDVPDPARHGHASASALVKHPALALSFLLSPQTPPRKRCTRVFRAGSRLRWASAFARAF
jgi:hypothetical protein